jgi:hypothetical protein
MVKQQLVIGQVLLKYHLNIGDNDEYPVFIIAKNSYLASVLHLVRHPNKI